MLKKVIGMCISIFLLITGFASASFSVPDVNTQVERNALMVTLSAGSYEFSAFDETANEIDMEGFGTWLYPGDPMVPVKTLYIGLPPGGEALSIKILSEETSMLLLPLPVRTAPGIADSAYETIFTSDTSYHSTPLPQNCCVLKGMSQFRKYDLAMIQFLPITFDSAAEVYILHESVVLEITYQITHTPLDVLLADTAMETEAQALIYNYNTIKTAYAPIAVPENRQNYDYYIITTAATATAINGFITWKTSIGYTVGTTTVTWIVTNYPAADTQQSIRNFLVANYATWGLQYVLLVGSHSTIPMRTCWPDPTVHTADGQHDIPTDYYYADLTGNWDSDGDGFYGEMGHDALDLTPEVYVGRIPSDSATTVSSITLKIQNFEQTAYTGWKKNAMLLGAVYGYANEDNSGNPRWDGAEVMEQIRTNYLTGFTIVNMYEKQGLSQCPYTCSQSLTNTNVKNTWSATSGYGIVAWASHGLQTQANRWLWGWDDGDLVPETTNGEITWPIFIQSSDTTTFYNTKPPVVFAASCYCAHPETSNNLGAALLIQGASAFIGATRTSWGSIGWTQPAHGGHGTVCYDFTNRILNQDEDCGHAMVNSKLYVFNTYPWGGWWDYANMYNFVLYGDPSMVMNLAPSTPVQPSGPTTGIVGQLLAYSTFAMEPTGDFLKYGWDWNGDFVVDQWDDNGGAYYPPTTPISTQHIWNSAGTYSVQVKAEDIYGRQSGFSTPLIVVITGGNTPPQQPQTPTGPAHGRAGVTYPYGTAANDLEADLVKYGWDWDGDKIVDQWDDNGGAFYPSGLLVHTQHSWSQQGTYTIYVMAEDIHGAQSIWSQPLTVTMPTTYGFWYQFPLLYRILTTFFSLL
ncbi:MAG: hypothetical protein KKC68_03170 [Candidatus Thermoplasmatota archaeon]|nr:hypothetical protein [Candidatus Thermoplasmatota archaeon]MBU1940753.1 hypothetical protein [Candidatus Thermoplasmatota archaeon]